MTTPRDPEPSPRSDEPSPPGGAELGFELPAPPAVSQKRVVGIGLLVLLAVAAAFLVGFLPKRDRQQDLAQGTASAERETTRVAVVSPKRLRNDRELVLPGSVRPFSETTLYPQTNGYVKNFLVDIGDRVEKGQPLAEIETPELDQQLDQARAALAQAEAGLGQARANRDYSNTSLARYKVLRPSGVASQQELDQRSSEALVSASNVTAAEAAVAVQQANLRRLAQSKRFGRVEAPFAGTITVRSIDRGSLVTAGNNSPLFRLVATDPVRVFVQIPQDIATKVQLGQPASINVREYADKRFVGTIARTSGALDPATRTLTTEVRVPNPDNQLLTGMYGEVTLTLTSPHAVLELPGTTLYNDAQGLRVAVVDAHSQVHFVKVTLERDLGATIQIASGLSEQDRVIRLGNATWTEGMHVEVESGSGTDSSERSGEGG
jgi:membrane fusion protein (multidrug efflux system)